MLAIYDTMQYIRPEVQTFVLGQAASAAAVLLAAGARGKRFALPHSRILIHQPWMEGGRGSGSDLEIQAREVLRLRDLQNELLARHTGQPLDRVARDLDRDRILMSDEAKDYGLIDDIIASRKRRMAAAS
jgi:ATP-dependent Clp protease protease subunit